MKQGLSISAMAQEIERQNATKRDFLAKTNSGVRVLDDGKTLELGVNGSAEKFVIGDVAHGQIAERLGIPRKYYDRMQEKNPALLAANVNSWFAREPENRMIRTLDGKARAFLSERYRALDNIDLAQAVLPVIGNLNLMIVSCEITERRLYIKAVDRSIEKDVPTGKKIGDGSHVFFDTLSPALCICNSEIGFGTLSIEVGTLTKMCTNLAWISNGGMRKYHVGGKALDLGEQAYAMLSDKTRTMTDKAMWMQVRDIVAGALDREKFGKMVERIAETVERKIDGNPVKVVELASEQFNWTEAEGGSVLKHLIQGGDLTQYGLFNAVTRTAEDLADYDRATEFEAIGGKIIDLTPDQWKEVGAAA